MKRIRRKFDIIDINLTTYKGIRKAITSWLDMGKRIQMTAEFRDRLKEFKKNFDNLQQNTHRGLDNQDVLIRQFIHFLGKHSDRIPIVDKNMPLYRYDKQVLKGVASLKAVKIAKPSPGSINTLNDMLNNWNGIENEMIDYDFFKNALYNLFNDYKEWKDRFKEAAGLDRTSDDVFKLLMAVYDNKHDLFFLQGYLLKHDIKINIDNAIEDIEVAMMDIYEMDEKKKDDWRALGLLDKFRKALV